MILSKRNFLIGATASLGIIAAPAIVRCESLMGIRAIENARYLTFDEIIYPDGGLYFRAVWCNGLPSQEMKTGNLFDVNMLDKNFLCNKMITPV